jgi:hypothetical protein
LGFCENSAEPLELLGKFVKLPLLVSAFFFCVALCAFFRIAAALRTRAIESPCGVVRRLGVGGFPRSCVGPRRRRRLESESIGTRSLRSQGLWRRSRALSCPKGAKGPQGRKGAFSTPNLHGRREIFWCDPVGLNKLADPRGISEDSSNVCCGSIRRRAFLTPPPDP